MKRLLFSALALCSMQCLHAQTKSVQLYAVAEGNYGTPNADIFKVEKGFDSVLTVSAPLYQTANGTGGFDVIQDFEVYGNKAVWGTKASNNRIVVANYPSFDSIRTFATTGAQCVGIVSGTKAYVSAPTGNIIRMVDMANNTLTAVSDPTSAITSYANYMVGANGYMYVALASKIVKIDTATNAVVSVILPNLGTVAGLQYDTAGKNMWILGKSGTTSAVIRMEVLNNDNLNTPVVFTGITNAAQLRFSNNKLYFLSGKSVYIYNIQSGTIPTSPVYTSTLGGTASGFAYGKSFAVDPVSGDFAIGHANGYASPSLFEVVDGTAFSLITSGSITGCRIVNELMLKTEAPKPPTPVLAVLPVIKGQCSVTLTAPTATSGTAVVTGTTTDPLVYGAQGTYNVTWHYTNAQGTTTQTQQVIVADTIAPVPDIAALDTLRGTCPYTVTSRPTATDNCLGSLTGITTSPLTYANGGTYTISWTYTDSNANTATQTQTVIVSCGPSSVTGTAKATCNIWPNPANDQLHIGINQQAQAIVVLKNVIGAVAARQSMAGKTTAVIDVAHLPAGLYMVEVIQPGTGALHQQKILIGH